MIVPRANASRQYTACTERIQTSEGTDLENLLCKLKAFKGGQKRSVIARITAGHHSKAEVMKFNEFDDLECWIGRIRTQGRRVENL